MPITRQDTRKARAAMLHMAAKEGSSRGVERLLAAGADATAKGECGWTALHWAAQGGRIRMVAALLAAGADVTATSKCGWTPLHLAARGRSREVVTALLAAGADVSSVTREGFTPRYLASCWGHPASFLALLEPQARAAGQSAGPQLCGCCPLLGHRG